MCPRDKDAYFGEPDLFTPQYDEAHISVTFTWDIKKAYDLAYAWKIYAKEVKLGGCAFNDRGNGFIPDLYVKPGCVFTSRGCIFDCPWCFVPRREGKIRELPILSGNIIMDNNLLACSKSHIKNVIKMLKTQRQISFNQGLDSRLMTDWFVEEIRGLKIKDIWLAMDYDGAEKPLQKAVNKLKKYFSRDKIRCYVLIGYEDETLKQAEMRLRKAWEIGTLPFAMLYRDENGKKRSLEWRRFQRSWCRPAAIKAMMKENI
jgi:hypothetical protein